MLEKGGAVSREAPMLEKLQWSRWYQRWVRVLLLVVVVVVYLHHAALCVDLLVKLSSRKRAIAVALLHYQEK